MPQHTTLTQAQAQARAQDRAQDRHGATAPEPPTRTGARRRLGRWHRLVAHGTDAGMATAEYAIVTVAAAGFGGLLLLLLRSDEVRGLLLGIIRGALTT